jgi:hypothetical protein
MKSTEKRWYIWYAALLAFLIVQIVVYAVLTKMFS